MTNIFTHTLTQKEMERGMAKPDFYSNNWLNNSVLQQVTLANE